MSQTANNRPITVRLDSEQLGGLERIKTTSKLTTSALIGLAVSAFVDHVDRTGKLPLAKSKRRHASS